MGKRIIQQRRGRGTNPYKVKRRSFRFKPQYPRNLVGEGEVVKLFNSPAHTAPLARVKYSEGSFLMPAFKGMVEGQKIKFAEGTELGTITGLKNVPVATKIYNIESRPNDGGKLIKTGGSSAEISRKVGDDIFVLMPSKKEKKFHVNCRATIGVCAGAGRLDKPFVTAGRKFHLKKSKGKLWPRTSACKMNAIDHPFGSGRGKVPKPRIAKRNASPGQKVGMLRPKRTGKKK